ncbi:MAG: hypothetical protein ACRCR5_03395 [Lactococcus garvieae]
MTDIIKFNDTHTPKTAIGMKKFELAEALNTITDLQNPHQAKKYTPEQRDHLFNKSMIKVCDILDIDLDMHEMMKTGAEGFSYSDNVESTEELKYILDNKVVYSREIENEENTNKIITRNAIKELDSNKVYGFILKDGEFIVTEPNIVKVTAQSADKRFCYGDFDEFKFDHDLENLEYIVLEDKSKVSGSTALKVVGKLTDEQDQPQNTVKSLLEDLQDMTYKAHELSYGDPTIFGHLVSYEVDCIAELLGVTELSVTAEVKDNLPANTIKEQLQELYSLNDSMFGDDIHALPRYTDGSEIKAKDLADMNMNALDLIAEMLGFELEEGATSWTRQEEKPENEMSDQEIYDSLPAEDKLNVDMLNKLREVRDHLLSSGQNSVSMNRVFTAISILEGGLGVIDHEEE